MTKWSAHTPPARSPVCDRRCSFLFVLRTRGHLLHHLTHRVVYAVARALRHKLLDDGVEVMCARAFAWPIATDDPDPRIAKSHKFGDFPLSVRRCENDEPEGWDRE